MVRLLSGKFATNCLVLELAMLADNISRMIDQEIPETSPIEKEDRSTPTHPHSDRKPGTLRHSCYEARSPLCQVPWSQQCLAIRFSANLLPICLVLTIPVSEYLSFDPRLSRALLLSLRNAFFLFLLPSWRLFSCADHCAAEHWHGDDQVHRIRQITMPDAETACSVLCE